MRSVIFLLPLLSNAFVAQRYNVNHRSSPVFSLDTRVAKKEIDSSSARQVLKLQKYSRLPVWPAWNGVFIWMVQQIFGFETAAGLEDRITGRVCPNFFDYSETTPFVMLVHHCHSFWRFDPFRYFQRTFFPEGFPAHPHRGMSIDFVFNRAHACVSHS